MSNDSRQLQTTSKPRGRPAAGTVEPPAQSDTDLAIDDIRHLIIKCLASGSRLDLIVPALHTLGELHERKARAEEPFYTVHQLQRRYGLARKTIERLGIPRHKIGNAVRYAAADVERYESTNRQETTADAP
jgi:hypothetical protein